MSRFGYVCAAVAAVVSVIRAASLSVAAASESLVLFDGSPATAWDTARDQARLGREFSVSELVQAPGCLRWRFVSKGVSFNDIFLRRQVPHKFEAIRVLVRNEGAAVTLSAKVADAEFAEWTPEPVKLDAGAGWQWVEFPREQWRVAPWSNDADGRLDLPVQYFTLIAFDVEPGVEYCLEVAKVEVLLCDRPVATVTGLTLPRVLKYGATYTASLSFVLDRACEEEGAWLSFRQGGKEMWRVDLPLTKPLRQVRPGEVVKVPNLRIQVPLFVRGGRYSVALRVGEAHIRLGDIMADEEVCTVTSAARRPGKTLAEVRPFHGVPTLFINGKPHNGMCYTAYGPSVEVFRDFARAGVHLYSFSATPTDAGYGLSQCAWKVPQEYDFSQLDQRVMMVLQADPQAYFFPRLYLHAPKWWSEQHPDEVVLWDPGDGNYLPFIHVGEKPAPSWASQVWRRDTVEGLRRLIAHIEASPWADRCIGYHLASGTTEEWMMWGANEDQWVDYSPASVEAFRRWLKDRYGAVEALRQAWRDPKVDFASAAIPPKARRAACALGSLRDPATEQDCIDFYLYNSELVADTICYFAKAVKDLTHRQKIVGVFYGYLLQLCGEQRQQNAGHLALEKVLSSPDVDFLCSPTSYAFRALGGEGTSHFMSLAGSVRMHGKLWFDENDIRTSLSGGQVGEWGRPADVAGDVLQQEKELANCLVNGAAQWWFDVGGNKYNDPTLMHRLAGLVESATEALRLDRAPVDEVAMVVDESSLCYVRVGDPIGNWFLLGMIPAVHRIGAPVAHYLVSDLPALSDRKLFLIMTSFAPTAAHRRMVDALKRDGHVLVFFYAPGLYRAGALDEGAMEDFTGLRLRLDRTGGPLNVKLATGDRLTEGLEGLVVGAGSKVAPIAYADDPAATPLAFYPDGRVGMAVKRFGSWTAVFSGVPIFQASVLRRLAEEAGVHFYIDTEDVVWASRELLAVCANEGGRRTIRLPRRSDVEDLYAGQSVASGVVEFQADFAPRQTRVFVVR